MVIVGVQYINVSTLFETINIEKVILENIDTDNAILENIDIDK